MKWIPVDRRYIYHRDGGRCRYCGKALRYGSMSLDHYLPHSAGGPDAVFNLVCTCKTCNRDKRAGIPEDWESVWRETFLRALADRKVALAPGLNYSELPDCSIGILSARLEGKTAIFDTKCKRFHVKQNEIIKITDINIFTDDP